MDRNSTPSVMPPALLHSSIAAFTRDWYGPDGSGLAQQVGDDPVFLAQLDGIKA
jgi:hypothetical protein